MEEMLDPDYKFQSQEDLDDALIYAAQIRDKVTLIRLISIGADVQARCSEALFEFLLGGDLGTAKYLISLGAKPEDISGEEMLFLMENARVKKSKLISFFLDFGFDVGSLIL